MRVFVSYSRRDAKFVERLVADLNQAGVVSWQDRTNIDAGDRWAKSIVEAVDNCDVLVLVLSPDSVVSSNVAREVALADDRQKRILPILIRSAKLTPALEYPLTGVQWVDFTNQNYDGGFSELLGALHRGSRPTVATSEAQGRRRRSYLTVGALGLVILALIIAIAMTRRTTDQDSTRSSGPTSALDNTTVSTLSAAPSAPQTTLAPATTAQPDAPSATTSVGQPRLLGATELTATASSALGSQPGCGGTCYYFAENILDGRVVTAWAEGVPGPGVGEMVTVQFDRPHHLTSIRIRPGWQREERCLFERNGRPTLLGLVFSDGSQVDWQLSSDRDEPTLGLDTTTSSVVLTVKEVQAGETCDGKPPLDEDTLITDVFFEVDD